MMIDLTRLIPSAVQQMAIDATIDFVAEKGKDLLSDEVSNKIASLRSDYGFQSAFKAGLQRAIERFIAEYSHEDEDLTDALTADSQLFEDKAVQATMLKILQHPGNLQNVAQETLVQSFDRVLPSRRNRERVNKAVAYFLKCLAEEVYHLPELRPLYELQFQRVTAESAREQVALQKAQLEATTAMSQDLRSALLQLTEAVVQQRLLPAPSVDLQGFGNLAGLPKLPRHNLPQPDYQRFVGRKEQLKQLGELLSPKHRAWVVTIDGIGGIGKSALALEVADSYRRLYERLAPPDRFEAIIWTTAKLTVLTGQGIITRSQSLRTLDDIYSTIAVVLQREDITRARPADQDEIVRQALSRQRTLLIVDNLETVDDERVMAFLRDVPSPTKVIVTTRHRLDVAYPIRVVGMTQEEALHLIADQAELKGLTLLPEQAQKLFERTGGVPLAMVWSVAQMAFGYGVETVLTRLGQPNNDVAKFCFEAAIERIKDKPAYKLLLALSLFATDASREALGFVADLPELDRDDGLVELEKLSLVNKEGARFSLLPLTKVLGEGELIQTKLLESKLRDKWVKFLFNVVVTESTGDKYERLNDVRVELKNVLGVMDWCKHVNRTRDLIEFVKKMDFYLHLTDNWNIWCKYIELGLNSITEYSGTQISSVELDLFQADLLARLSTIFDYQDDLDESQKLIRKSIDLYRLHANIENSKHGLTISLWRLGSILIHKKEYGIARVVLEDSINLAKKINFTSHIGFVQRKLAEIDIAEKNYEQAEHRLKQVSDIYEQDPRKLLTQLSYTYRLIGQATFLKGDYETAKQYFQQSLEKAEEAGSFQHIAEIKLRIAEFKFSQGNLNDAKIYIQDAFTIVNQLGMKRELREIQNFLARLESL